MNRIAFWCVTLAVCWILVRLLVVLEISIRRRLGICDLENSGMAMYKRMYLKAPGWCVTYIIFIVVHVSLLLIPFIGLAVTMVVAVL